jgi:hypothetical protein
VCGRAPCSHIALLHFELDRAQLILRSFCATSRICVIQEGIGKREMLQPLVSLVDGFLWFFFEGSRLAVLFSITNPFAHFKQAR